jgi:hypothetical protein
MVGYLRYSNQDPGVSLNSILSRLVLVKDNFGHVYWPGFGINTLSALVPGQGYQIYLSSPAVLTYPANDETIPDDSDAAIPAPLHAGANPQNHYVPSFDRTGANATLLCRFKETTQTGDELAVRNKRGEIVGAGLVDKGRAVAALWGDNAVTPAVDGALDGEILALYYWSASEKAEHFLNLLKLTDGMTGTDRGGALAYRTDAILIADLALGARVPTSVSSLQSIPIDFVLDQNYPNPFNPSTKITYGLPKEAQVSLEVYNVLGEKVGQLVDEVKTAGYYEVTFDGARLSSGIYLCRLTAGDYVQVKKMVLMR